MKIPDEHLDEFIALYKQKYGGVLDRQTAYEKASRLMRMIELVESNSYGHPSTAGSHDSPDTK